MNFRAATRSDAKDVMDEAAEPCRLRNKNARLLLENDILIKAAVILGTQPGTNPRDDSPVAP